MNLVLLKRAAPPAIAFISFISIWTFLVHILNISPLILPDPASIAAIISHRFVYLLNHSLITLIEAVLGFSLGMLAALSLAVLFSFSSKIERAIYPYAIAFKAVPLIALAPLLVVWFGSGLLSKVILAAIISFFPILVSTVQGLVYIDKDALDLMKTMSASRWQTLYKVRFPNALPSIFAGMKVSSSFAIVGAVVAEFIGANRGIGYVIKNSSYYLETELMFAAVVMAGITGLLFFGIVVLLERYILHWRRL